MKTFFRKISVRIILPVILIGVFTSLIGYSILDTLFSRYFTESVMRELQGDANEVIAYIKNQDEFNNRNLTESSETLQYRVRESLFQRLSFTDEHPIALFLNGETFFLRGKVSGFDPEAIKDSRGQLTVSGKGYFYIRTEYSPWKWTIFVFYEKSKYSQLLRQNKKTLLGTISFMIISIVAMLFFVMSYTLEAPLQRILYHLRRIREGHYAFVEPETSMEMDRLAEHINEMTSKIDEREREVLEQLKYMRSILNTQKSLLIILEGGLIIEANDSFLRFFHDFASVHEFQKTYQDICELFLDTGKENYVTHKECNSGWIERILEESESMHKAAVRRGEDTVIFSLEAAKVGFYDIERVIVVFTDITDLEQSRENLSDRVHEEVKKNQEKDSLIAEQARQNAMGQLLVSLSHHWKQPLNNLILGTEALKNKIETNDFDEDYLKKLVKRFENQIRRMSDTISLFSDQNTFHTKVATFDFLEFLQEVFDLYKKLGHQIDLEIQVVSDSEGDSTEVTADQGALNQVFFNLLNNVIDAWKAQNRKSGMISVRVEINNNIISVKFEDDAGGVSPGDLSHVFEPYFTTRGMVNHSGLGLFLSKKIVEETLMGEITAMNGAEGFIVQIDFPKDRDL